MRRTINNLRLVAVMALFCALALTLILAQEGPPVGIIGEIKQATKEIIVHSPEAAKHIKMGDRLYVRIDGKAVVMKAIFPMQTIAKCMLEGKFSGYWWKLGKGTLVYRWVPGVEEGEIVTAEPKTGTTKEVGGIEFVFIKGGEFNMGQPDPNIGCKGCSANEQPVHKVKVSSFWIGKYEVTQKQYQDVMDDNPSKFKGDNNPVERVSWYDAKNFCRSFSAKYGGTVRLPTEAEWEYACRAGTKTKYYWGNFVYEKYLWYDNNSSSTTHPVGGKLPNAWGLFDMSGNVWEWCEDWYGQYTFNDQVNPMGPDSGSSRVSRGGSWGNNMYFVQTTRRFGNGPGNKGFSSGGFRLVRME